jgi:HPr kinase/phosphorylase
VTGAAPQLVYGTCVALGSVGALLQGPSASGKSDLALRFALQTPPELGAALVADDQVLVSPEEGRLIARPPERIAGRIEVRGIGIVTLPFRAEAELRLLITLVDDFADVPRLPRWGEEDRAQFCGLWLPVLAMAPFEASACLKLRLALERVA